MKCAVGVVMHVDITALVSSLKNILHEVLSVRNIIHTGMNIVGVKDCWPAVQRTAVLVCGSTVHLPVPLNQRTSGSHRHLRPSPGLSWKLRFVSTVIVSSSMARYLYCGGWGTLSN